jgi:hypothetical protein
MLRKRGVRELTVTFCLVGAVLLALQMGCAWCG